MVPTNKVSCCWTCSWMILPRYGSTDNVVWYQPHPCCVGPHKAHTTRVMPHSEHAQWQWGSYGGSAPCLACTDNGASRADLWPSLCTLTVEAQTTLQTLWAVSVPLAQVLYQGLSSEAWVPAPSYWTCWKAHPACVSVWEVQWHGSSQCQSLSALIASKPACAHSWWVETRPF